MDAFICDNSVHLFFFWSAKILISKAIVYWRGGVLENLDYSELYGKWRNRNRKDPEEAPLTRYPGAVMLFDRVSHGTPSFEDGIR